MQRVQGGVFDDDGRFNISIPYSAKNLTMVKAGSPYEMFTPIYVIALLSEGATMNPNHKIHRPEYDDKVVYRYNLSEKESREERQVEIAEKLKMEGVDIDTIVKCTGLSREEVGTL